MARPVKKGCDYFPLDVNMDDNVKLLEAECGLKGFAIFIKLYQKIYSCGYYASFTKDVGLLFARENGVGVEFVFEVIGSAIRRGLFDKEIYDTYHVLTSRGIQSRYFEIKKKSKLLIYEKYLLLSATNLPVNVTITTVNTDLMGDNAETTTTKKRKEKERKEEIPPRNVLADKFSIDSQELMLANHLQAKILESCPTATRSNMQKWANVFRLMMERDKRDYEDIRLMINYAHYNDFWRGVILSPDKLRAKWTTLFIQREKEKKRYERT